MLGALRIWPIRLRIDKRLCELNWNIGMADFESDHFESDHAEGDQQNAAANELGAALWAMLLRDPAGVSDGSASTPSTLSPRLQGKRVLITGAAGSIGSALTFAAQASGPASLLLLDHSETGLYELDRSLLRSGTHHTLFVGSVCDPHLLNQLFAVHRPHIVFHAAAYKHVPLMEQNPFAAIHNNALGSFTLASTAAAHGAEQLVLVSTDKAADPASIMGASKHIAELAWLSVGARSATQTFAVRLGNVAGTRGSVLPLFLDQLRRHVPLSVTHPDARRYFMSIDEAVAALFAALACASSPALLVPDLASPIRILDLARQLIRLRQSDLPIHFTGVRPGDKMTETLLGVDESWSNLLCAGGLRMLEPTASPLATFDAGIGSLEAALRAGDRAALLREVLLLVPRYQPSSLLRSPSSSPLEPQDQPQQQVHL